MDKFIDQLPFFTPEHRTLAADMESFVQLEIEPRASEERDMEAQLHEFIAVLAKAGALHYAIASPGAKLDVRALCLIREALSYSSALADLAFVMQGLGTFAISQAAPEHLRDFWVSRAVEGKAIAAFALTEPEAGSDVAAIKTTARREGDAYVINGRKRFISNAGVADFYTVFARTGTDANGRASLSAFVVGARMPGFRVIERTAMIASHPIVKLSSTIVAFRQKTWLAARARDLCWLCAPWTRFGPAWAPQPAEWRGGRLMKRCAMQNPGRNLAGHWLSINSFRKS